MSKRQLPTHGPWCIDDDGDIREVHQRRVIAFPIQFVGDGGDFLIEEECLANARLIAAAGTAADACEQLGYDGTRAIEALPTIIDAAENILIGYGMGWDMDGLVERLRDALAAAKPEPISPSDSAVLRAGLAQFGPSHDGAVERDIAAAKPEGVA